MADERENRLADLADALFVDLPATRETRILLETSLTTERRQRKVRCEINDISNVANFVEQDLAVAVLPPSFVPPHLNIRFIPFSDGPSFVLSLASPTERQSSAAAALARVVTDVATST